MCAESTSEGDEALVGERVSEEEEDEEDMIRVGKRLHRRRRIRTELKLYLKVTMPRTLTRYSTGIGTTVIALKPRIIRIIFGLVTSSPHSDSSSM